MGDTKRAAAREIVNGVSPLRRATGGSPSPSSGPPSARRGTDLSPKGQTSAGGAEVDDRTKATGPPSNASQEVRVGVGQVPLKPLAVARAPSERQSPQSNARSARISTGAGLSGRTAVRPSPREASDLPRGKIGATPHDENVIRVTPRVSDSGVGLGADDGPVMEPKPPPSTRMEECKTQARPERPQGPSMQAPAQAPRSCSPVAGVKIASVESMRPFAPASVSVPSSTTQGGGPGSQPAKTRESPSTPEPNSRPMYQSLSIEQQPVMLGGALFKKPASMEKLFVDTTELISIVSKNPYKSPSPIPLPDAAGGPRPWERENAAAALGFNTKPSMSEKRAKLRGSMALPLPDGVLARVRHILGDTVDTGELLSLLKSSAQEQAALGGHGDGSSPGAGQKGAVASCWEHVLKSKPYKLLSSIQESVARVYVLATAKQLLEGVVETRLATDKAKNAELDLRCLTDMIAANVRVLTSFSALSEAPQMDGRTEAQSCLASLPVPALVVKYFRTIPFLSQAFITLVRSSLKLLMTSDEQVRRITLENSVSGRYFFSSSLLKRDLETIWEYLSVVRVYLEFYGQLSRDIFVQTVLPFTPLTKLEIFALISVGHARQKVALEQEQKREQAATSVGSITDSARLTGPTSPTSTRAGDKGLKLSVAGPAMNEMDPDTLDAICTAFFSEDPFRCSPFLVTFAPRGMDVRPTYATLAKETDRFPQLFLSLSRHLYVTRCTPEGIEEFFKQHYSVVHDYLTCSQLARIAGAALGEIEPVVQLTQRACGDWTANLYADMVVSSFISRFYKDFTRRVATDTSVLAFSRRFEEVRSDQEYREGPTGDTGMHQTSDNFNRLSDAKGTSIELKSWEGLSLGPVYILMVSERALEGLRLADKICMRDPMCACEMAGAIVMWYILWARASLGRCVSATNKPPPEDRGPAAPPYSHIFDSLRRVCALCSDVNSIAQFCESMLSRVRIDDEVVCAGPRTARSPTTPTGGGGYFFGSSSVLPSTPSGGGSKTTRKGFIVSPGHKSQKLAATRSVSSPPGPETTMAGLMTMGGRKTTDNGSMVAYVNGGEMAGDVTGHEVVMNDLMGMVEDLRLLAAECLEHATEIATRLAVKICSDRLLSVSSTASRPIRAVPPTGVDMGGNGAAAAAAAPKRGESSRGLRAGRASLPATKQPASGPGARVWAVELRTAVLQPLASFCRSDQFCSECLLPRLVEACLNAALEFIAEEMEGKVTVAEGHALHADFLALKLWTEAEQRSQKWACALSRLSVFDRIHVIMNILCLPPSLANWSQGDKASLYLLPDAPEWINVRADRGRCSSYQWIGFSRNPASVAPLCLRRLSVSVASMDLYEFDKVWSEHASRHHGASEIHHAIA